MTAPVTALRESPPPYATRREEPARRALNLRIREDLIDEARASGLNLSRFVEDRLGEALMDQRAQRWYLENKEAVDAHNEHIRRHGVWHKGRSWYR